MYDLDTELQNLSAEQPIALLPVRIETRFSISPPELRVRIYPDEIFANLHRRTLTKAESKAAEAYWTDGWEPANEPAAWSTLVAQYGTERSAWIAAATEPTNIGDRPNGGPQLRVAEEDERAGLAEAMAALLPMAWMAIAYRAGNEVHRVTGEYIPKELRMSFQSDLAESDPHASVDELEIDPELLWAIDFNEARAKGMALTMPISTGDLTAGFDRVLVLGVRTSTLPEDSAAELAALFDAHHYTRGLALIRQGTPTNSTEQAPSGYPPPADPDRSFAIERGPEVVEPGSDGDALTRALGLDGMATFDHVEGTRRREQAAASAMNLALWPCTLGYFLEQMARPLVTADQIADVRAHFVDRVRGRGPLPAIRVGSVPYGILPVTSIDLWAGGKDTIEEDLAALLKVWQAAYRSRIAGVPRIGRTNDSDADLLEVLGRDAAAREVRVREVIGPGYFLNELQLLGYNLAQVELDRQALIDAALVEAGITGEPRLARMTLADTAPRIGRPFVTTAPLSEDLALSPNYITEVRTSPIDSLGAAGDPSAPQFQNPLLYHLLRQATLVEYARIGVDLALGQGIGTELDRVELELVGIAPGTEKRITPWGRFAAPLDGLTGSDTLGQWLLEPNTSDPERAPVRSHQEALLALEALPTAELARLLTETLDVCSHRLDAWLTSLATRRLAAMRHGAPVGIHVGAFAWVENLRRRDQPRPGTAGGFIHAPSANHAAAAAVLRNAHLTRAGAARDRVAIDLSSRRVRSALELIDGVRQGQPLGAVLGYRFERALHDANLDRYIEPFRGNFPLGRDPAVSPEQPGERIAARNVVDGLALRDQLGGAMAASEIPWGPSLSLVANADRAAVAPCLLRLEDAVDAAADLLLAESVYQAVQGNTDRAAATLAALGGSADIPDPTITAVPRRGIGFTHRVAIVLGPGGALGWPSTARGAAEPRLDAWVGSLLGAPAGIAGSASYPDPTPEDPERRSTATVTLQQLGLGPLDVIALARATALDGGGELRARIEAYVNAQHGRRNGVTIDCARMAGMVSFLEASEVARLVGELIDAARPLEDGHLIVPGNDGAGPDAAEIMARAAAVVNTAVTRHGALANALSTALALTPPASLDSLRGAMWAVVSLGITAAAPASLEDADLDARRLLLDQAAAALAELDRRIAAATAAGGGLAKLAGLFGPTLRVLPTFIPTNRGDVEAAIAHGPTLVGNAYAPRRWFEGAACVRPQLADLRLVLLASEAISGTRVDLRIAQLPHEIGRPWVGAEVDPANPPRAGSLSIAMLRPAAIPSTASWAGLLLDEWNELIPSAVQETAFAVHHDAPGAEAAQCILLAVPPVLAERQTWDLASLVAILQETLDLAAIRTVDAEQLGALNLLVPTTYLAANLAGDTITSDLSALSIGEDAILAPE